MKQLFRPAISWIAVAAGVFVVPACGGGDNGGAVAILNIRLQSRSSVGAVGSGSSRHPAVSSDGRITAFESVSYNLDPRDGNTLSDIYVRDAVAGTTSLVSVSSGGTASGNNTSDSPAISPDGRFVAFASRSTNLVAGLTDGNGNFDDIFLRDLLDNVTVCVSVTSASATATGNSFSSGFDGLAVTSDAAAAYVAFVSSSTNLVAGGTTGFGQVFIRRIPLAAGSLDNALGETILVSRTTTPTTGANGSSRRPSIGQDGSALYLAWSSFATNQVAPDTDSTPDILWRAVSKTWPAPAVGVPVLVSINRLGTAGGGNGVGGFTESDNPSLSENGDFVAWDSAAVDLVPSDANQATKDIFRRGPMTGAPTTGVVSLTSTGSQTVFDYILPSISATGQFVAFESASPDIVPGDLAIQTDVFVRDATGGTTTRASLTVFGNEPDSACLRPAISGNGQFVVFESSASNITGTGTFISHIYRRGP